MTLILSKDTSISDHIPIIQQMLDRSGYALARYENAGIHEIASISALFGKIQGMENMSHHVLSSVGSSKKLASHVECIFLEGDHIPYFVLACLQASDAGGQTRIFDGRSAAARVAEINGLSEVEIEYSSLAYPEKVAQYSLISGLSERTLKYRSVSETNKIIKSNGLTENEIYGAVERILSECVVLEHSWRVGDILFVNNRITLHDRLPFSGRREMLRVRYNDPLNSIITF